MKQAIRDEYGTSVGLSGRGEMIPNEQSFCEIDPEVKDRWGIPVLRFHWAWSDHELNQVRHMQTTFRAILEAMGGRINAPQGGGRGRGGRGAAQTTATGPMPGPAGAADRPGGSADRRAERAGRSADDGARAAGGPDARRTRRQSADLARRRDHPRGRTVRMGDDPQTSVLNKYCQAHEVKNLFVADAAPFVSNADKNPTHTIIALAWRTAEYLAEEMRKGNV